MKWKLAVFVVLLSPWVAWSETKDVENQAVEVAKTWLSIVDTGTYGQSWENAAGYFKTMIKKAQWEQTISAVRGSLGAVVSRSLKSATYTTSLPGAPDGKYVVIQFSSSFKNKVAATETVTPMLDRDGQWRVAGYYIK